MSRSAWLDLVFGLATILFALALQFYFIPVGIVAVEGSRALSPGFWPTLVAWFLILPGAIVAAGAILHRQPANAASPDTGETESIYRPLPQALFRVAAALAIMLAYYFLLPVLGMLAASVLLIFAYALLLGARNWMIVVPVAILVPAALYLFFTRVAGTALPEGALARFLF